MSSERFLATEGIHNFRDYGGWPVEGGGTVRTGLLYRSGQHVGATDADLAAIAALGIRTVIDLRGNGERERHPCRRVEGWDGEVIFFDGETTNAPPHMDVGESGVTAALAKDRMHATYTRIPHNPAAHATLGTYLRALADREGASLVHCFAGKDRTGVAVALLHHILGVSRADALAEFMLTNAAPTYHVLLAQSVPRIEERFGKLDEGAVRALMEVQASYLDTFHAEVERGWGSLDDWLAAAIGVDDAMRARLQSRLVA